MCLSSLLRDSGCRRTCATTSDAPPRRGVRPHVLRGPRPGLRPPPPEPPLGGARGACEEGAGREAPLEHSDRPAIPRCVEMKRAAPAAELRGAYYHRVVIDDDALTGGRVSGTGGPPWTSRLGRPRGRVLVPPCRRLDNFTGGCSHPPRCCTPPPHYHRQRRAYGPSWLRDLLFRLPRAPVHPLRDLI